jgi:hypothetical protein
MQCKSGPIGGVPRRRAGRAATGFLLAALAIAALGACEGGGSYQAPAYNLDKCFWQPWLPNC